MLRRGSSVDPQFEDTDFSSTKGNQLHIENPWNIPNVS